MSTYWIQGLNIYPLAKINIVKKLSNIYEGGKKVGKSKAEVCLSFTYLVSYPKNRRNEAYDNKVSQFNDLMQTGFDISTKDVVHQKQMEDKYKVKMKDEDYLMLEDNCKEKKCECDWDALVKCKCS